METEWVKLFEIAPVYAEGLAALICGIYQLITGKESFLMWRFRQKYNYKQYRKKCVKSLGWIYIILAAFLVLLLPLLFLYATVTTMVLVSLPTLLSIGIVEYMIIRLYTDNLENRKY